jgi:hypothetical protein
MWQRIYLKSAVFLLFVTAGGKLGMALGHAKVLDQPSPLFHDISYREFICLGAGLEIAVALYILLSREKLCFPAVGIACLSTSFVGYRLILWAIGFEGYCSCLGSLSDALYLSPEDSNSVAVAILIYLFLGSYGMLLAMWRGRRAFRKLECNRRLAVVGAAN